MTSNKPTAIVYIDGLSLFYRKLKGKNHLKWLDVEMFARSAFPEFDIIQVKYFTAIAKQLAGDNEIGIRQSISLRAIKCRSSQLVLSQGYIRIDTKRFPSSPITYDFQGNLVISRVYGFEEKETDVRIAMTITRDVIETSAENYLLISADKDFEPLNELFLKSKNRFRRVTPTDFRDDLIAKCQLPQKFECEVVLFEKPRAWLT